MPDISEKSFDTSIDCALRRLGPDAYPGDPKAVSAKIPPGYMGGSTGGIHTRSVKKIKVCVEHFLTSAQNQIGGKAKAMIVTRSRLHAVRYKLAPALFGIGFAYIDEIPRSAQGGFFVRPA